jgi:hypothetical protein
MRGAHHAFDCRASSFITPPNAGSGAGSCLPLMLVVALAEPSSPVTSWAKASGPVNRQSTPARHIIRLDHVFVFILHFLLHQNRDISNGMDKQMQPRPIGHK